jgi:hypothetical protein
MSTKPIYMMVEAELQTYLAAKIADDPTFVFATEAGNAGRVYCYAAHKEEERLEPCVVVHADGETRPDDTSAADIREVTLNIAVLCPVGHKILSRVQQMAADVEAWLTDIQPIQAAAVEVWPYEFLLTAANTEVVDGQTWRMVLTYRVPCSRL